MPPQRLPLYRQRREHTSERRAAKIEPLTAPECGRDYRRLAFDNRVHQALRGFVENPVHGGFAAPLALRQKLYFRGGQGFVAFHLLE